VGRRYPSTSQPTRGRRVPAIAVFPQITCSRLARESRVTRSVLLPACVSREGGLSSGARGRHLWSEDRTLARRYPIRRRATTA